MSYESETMLSPGSPLGTVVAAVETVVDDLVLAIEGPEAAAGPEPDPPPLDESPVGGHAIADLTPAAGEDHIPVHVAGISIPGRRIANEDTVYYEAREAGSGHLRAALGVADGGSELNTGSLASKMAIGKFRAGAEHVARDATIEPSLLLAHACRRAHEGIREAIQERRAMGRPFTSFLGAYIVGNGFTLGHIGNSRAYLVRRDRVVALTQDHGAVEPVGHSTSWDSTDSVRPSKHLGSDAPCEVEILPATERYYRVQPGEVLVLCSDGLSTVIDGDKIREVLTRTQSIEEACELLASLALVKGSNDNVSIVCAEFGHLPRRARSVQVAAHRPLRPGRRSASAGLPLGKVAAATALVVGLLVSGAAIKHTQVSKALTPVSSAHELSSVWDGTAPSPAPGPVSTASLDPEAVVVDIEEADGPAVTAEGSAQAGVTDRETHGDTALSAMTAAASPAPVPAPIGQNSVAGANGPEAGPLPTEGRHISASPRGTTPRSASPAVHRNPHATVAPRAPKPALSGRRVQPPSDLPALPRSGGVASRGAKAAP